MNILVAEVCATFDIEVEDVVARSNEYGECMFAFGTLLRVMQGVESSEWAPDFIKDWCLDVLTGKITPNGVQDETE